MALGIIQAAQTGNAQAGGGRHNDVTHTPLTPNVPHGNFNAFKAGPAHAIAQVSHSRAASNKAHLPPGDSHILAHHEQGGWHVYGHDGANGSHQAQASQVKVSKSFKPNNNLDLTGKAHIRHGSLFYVMFYPAFVDFNNVVHYVLMVFTFPLGGFLPLAPGNPGNTIINNFPPPAPGLPIGPNGDPSPGVPWDNN